MVAATYEVVVTPALQSVVDRANGRRRTRTLPAQWIADAAADLAPGERQFFHGGHVANAYGFAAIATVAVVWRDEAGQAYATVTTGNAKRGCTGFGRRDIWTIPTTQELANLVSQGETVAL